MNIVHNLILSYQHQISQFDKNQLEHSIDEQLQRTCEVIPKRLTTDQSDLIDIDLVQGSAFPKAKPGDGWFAVIQAALPRLLLFPLYYRWWIDHTRLWLFALFLTLYSAQLASLFLYASLPLELKREIYVSEVVSPIIIAFFVGVLHVKIVAIQTSNKPRSGSASTEPRYKSPIRTTFPNGPIPNGSTDNPRPSPPPRVDLSEAASCTNCQRRRESKIRSSALPLPKVMTSRNRFSGIDGDEDTDHEAPPNRESDDVTASTARRSRDVRRRAKSEEISAAAAADFTPNDVASDRLVPALYANPRSTDDSGFDVPPLPLTSTIVASSPTDGEVLLQGCSADVQFLEESGGSSNTFLPLVAPTGELFALDDVANDFTEIGHHSARSSGIFNSSPLPIDATVPVTPPRCESVPSSPVKNLDGQKTLLGNLHLPTLERADSGEFFRASRGASREPSLPANEQPFRPSLALAKSAAFNQRSDSSSSPAAAVNQVRFSALSPAAERRNAVKSSEQRGGSAEKSGGSSSTSTGAGSSRLAWTKGRRRKRHPSRSDPTVTESEAEVVSPVQQYVCGAPRVARLTSVDSDADTQSKDVISEMESEYPIRIYSTDSSSETDDAAARRQDGQAFAEAAEPPPLVQPPPARPFYRVPDFIPPPRPLTDVGTVTEAGTTARGKVTCLIWEATDVCKKTGESSFFQLDLGMLDLAHIIIDRVSSRPLPTNYLPAAVFCSMLIGCFSLLLRLKDDVPLLLAHFALSSSPNSSLSEDVLASVSLSSDSRVHYIVLVSVLTRLSLSACYFFFLCVAQRTFEQRLLYAKHFCYLTSSRRASKYGVPHFRLNKVRNIKTWLTLRSFIKRHGPQNSVDAIVSANFVATVLLVCLLCVQLLQEKESSYLADVLLFGLTSAAFLMHLMTVGVKINKKYRNLSVLITEQINLYLKMEQKPHKKETLMLANNVLKLAEALLKELENPFKISGLSANPVLYNVTKVVVLSAFSGVLSELLGFKLKLYKIKLS